MTVTIAAAQSFERLRSTLITKFPSDKVDRALSFFNKLRKEARYEHWDSCISDGGAFVEAILKCFQYQRTGIQVDAIDVAEEVKFLEQEMTLSGFEQPILPQVLKLIYEFSSRGSVMHNSSFDAIRMDCIQVVSLSKWVIEELARLYLVNDASAIQVLIDNLPPLQSQWSAKKRDVDREDTSNYSPAQPGQRPSRTATQRSPASYIPANYARVARCDLPM